jgi:hypothetical protein
LPFFFANVAGQSFRKSQHTAAIQTTRGCLREIFAKLRVFGDQFLDNRPQFVVSAGRRKQVLFLGRKVKLDLLREMLVDFRLPGLQLLGGGKFCPADTYT